jgi:hypothetical protein
MGCLGASACIASCNQTYPASVTMLDEIQSCLTLKCLVCSESGIGDPCGPGANPCVTGLTCNGLWCTKGCLSASDCVGIGPNGGNFTGETNECISTASGDVCTPGCAVNGNADCADFPNTFCRATTSLDRLVVSICSTLPDGG